MPPNAAVPSRDVLLHQINTLVGFLRAAREPEVASHLLSIAAKLEGAREEDVSCYAPRLADLLTSVGEVLAPEAGTA
jgi:hypothetical protein